MRHTAQEATQMLRKMNRFSSVYLKLGLLLMPLLYLSAGILHLTALQMDHYILAMQYYQGLLDIAPATGLAAISMAFFIDIVLEKEMGVHKKK